MVSPLLAMTFFTYLLVSWSHYVLGTLLLHNLAFHDQKIILRKKKVFFVETFFSLNFFAIFRKKMGKCNFLYIHQTQRANFLQIYSLVCPLNIKIWRHLKKIFFSIFSGIFVLKIRANAFYSQYICFKHEISCWKAEIGTFMHLKTFWWRKMWEKIFLKHFCRFFTKLFPIFGHFLGKNKGKCV